jgi:phage shock protein C
MSRKTDPAARPSPDRLYRNPHRGLIRGVCAGIADYFGVAPWIVRVAFLFALFIFTPATLIAYILAAIFLPPAPERLYESHDEETFWRGMRTEPAQTFSALRHRFRELERRLRDMEAYVTSPEARLSREIDDLER